MNQPHWSETVTRILIILIVSGIIAWNLNEESFNKLLPILTYILGVITTYYFKK